MDDGGRPAGVAVQAEAPNRPPVLRPKAVVLSGEGKGSSEAVRYALWRRTQVNRWWSVES